MSRALALVLASSFIGGDPQSPAPVLPPPASDREDAPSSAIEPDAGTQAPESTTTPSALSQAEGDTAEPGVSTTVDASATDTVPPSLPPPSIESSHGYPEPPLEGHGMAVAGVVLVVASIAGYVAMAVGFGIRSYAEDSLTPLAEDAARRETLERRIDLGRNLAIGAGVSAAALLVTGIPLIVVGRQRARADLRRREKLRVTATPLGTLSVHW